MHPQQQTIDGLRQFADWLEANPVPKGFRTVRIDAWDFFVDTKDQLAEAARWLGSCEKKDLGTFFTLRKTLGAIRIGVSVDRQKVCERVKVGERVCPAEPEMLLPAKPERIEEVYEWKCPESVLA